jgi:hypothetical protein
MRQTAVEWLQEQYYHSEGKLTRQDFVQAKQMEIEQIRRAFCHGEVARDRIDSMEYYLETYKSQDK